ncbi:MAG: large subunit ribosomal protein [Patescibacteria group bacterium]|nr:large subunit ribosomal protein [Patescibacteria group bacterium]
MNYLGIIKGVVLTEKSNMLVEKENKYTFEVASNVTKGTIKAAVESLYGVKVLNINVLKTAPKSKKSWVKGRKQFLQSAKHKAIVELAEKDTIKAFTGGNKK